MVPLPAGPLLAEIANERDLARSADLLSIAGTGPTLWRINAAQLLVVAGTSREAAIDDAFECGRIAASAALTAVHATAAAPLFARLSCACPAAATDAARKALVEGVAVALVDAGATLADAQWVDAPVLRFDLSVTGVVRPDRVRGPTGALDGDVLIVASPLGAGIYAAAHAKGKLTDDDRRVLIADATRTSAFGIAFGRIRNVHAVATIGDDGLIAAVLALAASANLDASIESASVPSLPRALSLARTGCVAKASSRNWNRDGAAIALDDGVMPETRSLLTDPQTGGALLIACKRESVERVLKLCETDGRAGGAAIGTLRARDASDGDKRQRISLGV